MAATSEGPLLVAGNIYYGNTSNTPNWAGEPPLQEFGNTVPASSPLNSPGTGDFTVTTAAKEAGYHQVFRGLSGTGNYMDTGAAQREEPTGGGGGGTVVY